MFSWQNPSTRALRLLGAARQAACRATALLRSLAAPVMKADDAHARNRHFFIVPLQFELQVGMLNFTLGVAEHWRADSTAPAAGLAGPNPLLNIYPARTVRCEEELGDIGTADR